MLLQSHAGEIEFLPALTKSWPSGSPGGLCARGDFEVDIAWRDGKLLNAAVRAKNGGVCKIRYGGKTTEFRAVPGQVFRFCGDLR
jgi:alpha-L-fucosidase 2